MKNTHKYLTFGKLNYGTVLKCLSRLGVLLLLAHSALLTSSLPTAAITVQEVRLLCSGLGSKFAGDDDANISVDSSGLRATTEGGKLSVFEGDQLILEVEDFSYEKYTDCVLKIIEGSNSETPEGQFPSFDGTICLAPEQRENGSCIEKNNEFLVFLDTHSTQDVTIDINLEWFGFDDPCGEFADWDNEFTSWYVPAQANCDYGFRVQVIGEQAIMARSGNDYRLYRLRGDFFVGSVGSVGTPEYELTAQ